ncbi:hypothetical protein [Sphingobacterium griseoflavum]|uniref:Uncharacterized protein n=1 Tax=Sphingobacterium griseoflavum TaxID=1474952 RepID=A0ABQ3I0K8_9SPHI|nr:hypothetical protein [Sphingobacterium griseoflavum]GHE38879.1 hypothetical protein GCM10017764_22550 [Sphingobacterium griseoflavum]
MDDFSYEIIGTLAVVGFLFLGLSEWAKYRRFKRYIRLVADIRLHPAQKQGQHVVTGSLGLTMSQAEPGVKGLAVLSLSFRHDAFSIPTADKLYFKADSMPYLSVGFRIRRHDLRPLRGKRVSIRVKGRLHFKDGGQRWVKATIAVGIPLEEAMPDAH